MQTFASMLVNVLLMSLVVLIFLLVRVPMQRRIRPATSYVMGIILVIGLLIPLRPALPVAMLPAPAPIQQLAAPELLLPDTIPYDYDFMAEPHQERVAEAVQAKSPAALAPDASPAAIDIWQVAVIVWLAGALLTLVYHVSRHLRFRHLVRRWHGEADALQQETLAEACAALRVKKPPQLWPCGAVKSPMLIGLFRPVILLPLQPFSSEELEAILRHELVHLTRHDLWYKALILAATCLHWWNPLVRRLARAISADCEMSCDDAVLRGASIAQRKQYGETILGTISRQAALHAALSTYFCEGRTDMKRRFASMLNIRPRRAGGLLVVACLCLTFITGSVFATEGTTTAPTSAQAVSPTTGMAYPQGRDDAYRPVLVELSNTVESRPLLGISLADVVYEYIFWGPGHTRYLALYNDYHPEMVGAVRSSKPIGMTLRGSWDCPIVFIGGRTDDSAASVYQYIEQQAVPDAMLFDEERPTPGTEAVFSRITTREMPHNAVANLQMLVNNYWPAGADGEPYQAAQPALQFTNSPSEDVGPSTEIIVTYDEQDYLLRYTYSASKGYYERWYNGEPQIDGLTGQRITAENVIILHAELSYYNNSASQVLWNLTGKGALDVYIDGHHTTGQWERADEDAQLRFLDQDGNPMLLNPGKTYIQVVSPDMPIYQNK